MLIRDYPLDLKPNQNLISRFQLDTIVFFDIETTGFSADSSYLYLIGCIYYNESSFHILQWFMEDVSEEKDLITKFFEFIKNYSILIHYNGTGFDLPFLTRKCFKLGLDFNFFSIASYDLYKAIQPFKNLLSLSDLKQKTVEKYFDVHRSDELSGEELITVFQSFLGKRTYERLRNTRLQLDQVLLESDLLLQQILLHNEDDLKGLVQISSLLGYEALFERQIENVQAEITEHHIIIGFTISADIPVPLHIQTEYVHFTAFKDKCVAKILLYKGELKHFYDNYKEYYYLPEEDTAIHSSVAAFVDKEFKVKAKQANCYIRKQGVFAPQYEAIISPNFKHNAKDKITFFEIKEEVITKAFLVTYVSQILNHLFLSNKKSR